MVEQLRPMVPSSRPTVSIVIPNYNYGQFLRAAVMSATQQEGVELEVVVVDNASTDDSPQIASALSDADPRVKCILRETNQGQIANFNEALSYARGQYVGLLCADDLLAPGALRRATDLLETRSDVSFVYGHAPHFGADLPTARTRVRSWSVWSGPEWVNRICRCGHSLIASPEVIMRRSVADELEYQAIVGGYDDFKMWLDATRYGGVGRINGVDQGFYRVHEMNQHLTESQHLTSLSGRAHAFEDFFADECGRLRGTARAAADEAWRRALATEALDGACRSYDRGRVLPAEADKLESFALTVYAGTRGLPGWRGLKRRQRIGATCAKYWPPFFAAAVRRRFKEEAARRRWLRGEEWL